MISSMEPAPGNTLEFRFHARAGQGAKAAAQILAEAALLAGKEIQAFPQYGPERRGAPVTAFVRISDQAINLHSDVQNPDYVVVLDHTLLTLPETANGITSKTTLLINSSQFAHLKAIKDFTGQVYAVDGSQIAKHFLGKNWPNVALLGALAKVSSVVSLSELKNVLEKSMASHWGGAVAEKNYLCAKMAFSDVKEVVR